MEGKNNNNNGKETAIDDLLLKMVGEFEKSNKLTDKKIEELATIVQDSLMELKTELKDEIKEIKSNTEDIKTDLNKKVDVFTHNDLKFRVDKLEKKFA